MSATAKRPPRAALVEFAGVSVLFDGRVRALDDVTLAIGKGEIVGLVGESGSGKSTLCRVLVGLTPPSSGTVKVGDRPVGEQLAQAPLAFRRRAQLLLQDAVASLSPRMTIGRTLEEPIAIHALPRARNADAARRDPEAPRPVARTCSRNFRIRSPADRRAASVSPARC